MALKHTASFLPSTPWGSRESHVAEIVLSVAVFVGTAAGMVWEHFDPRVVVVIDICTALTAISVAIVKQHVTKTVRTWCEQYLAVQRVGLEFTNILADLGGERWTYARLTVERARDELEKIQQGRIPLEPREYYRELRLSLEGCESGDVVYAVSSFDPLRWREDRNQRRWLESNLAAVRKGVRIYRVFVLRRDQLASNQGDAVRQLIAEQKHGGIDVHAIWVEDAIKEDRKLRDDFVVFPSAKRVFVDYHDREEPMRVGSAEMIVPPNPAVSDYQNVFESLWLAPAEPDESLELESGNRR